MLEAPTKSMYGWNNISELLYQWQARWSAELQDYDFQITHKPGKLQARSDGLSRRRDHDDISNDNKDQ